MLVVFSPIFAADTKVISNHDFAVLLMERVIFCVVNVEGMVLSNEIFLYVVKQASSVPLQYRYIRYIFYCSQVSRYKVTLALKKSCFTL